MQRHDANPLPWPLTRSQPTEARLAIVQPRARKAVSGRSAARFALGGLRRVVHCFGARTDTAWHAGSMSVYEWRTPATSRLYLFSESPLPNLRRAAAISRRSFALSLAETAAISVALKHLRLIGRAPWHADLTDLPQLLVRHDNEVHVAFAARPPKRAREDPVARGNGRGSDNGAILLRLRKLLALATNSSSDRSKTADRSGLHCPASVIVKNQAKLVAAVTLATILTNPAAGHSRMLRLPVFANRIEGHHGAGKK